MTNRYPWEEIVAVWEAWFNQSISMRERDETLDWYRERLHRAREHSTKLMKERINPSISEEEMKEIAAKWTGTVTKAKPKSSSNWVQQITDDFLKESK
jgi:hypothetical protein